MTDSTKLSEFDTTKLSALKDAGKVNIFPVVTMVSMLVGDSAIARENVSFSRYYELCAHINFIQAADYAYMDNYSFFCRHKYFGSKVKNLNKKYPSLKNANEITKAAIENTTSFAKARADERGIDICIDYDPQMCIDYADIGILDEFKDEHNLLEAVTILPSSKTPKMKRAETFDRLDSALTEADVKFDTTNHKLFYTDSLTHERKVIDDFDLDSFVSFLRLVFRTSIYFGVEPMLATSEDAVKYVDRMLSSNKFVANYADSNIIQFLDCYVEKGTFKPGIAPDVPRFYINRSVYETVRKRKTQTYCSEMDDLIAHLCQYDHKTIEAFKSRFSTFLMNDSNLKSSYEVTANILFGASGGNGKSLFVECMQRAVGEENVETATFSGFDNSNFELPAMCNSLIVVDGDIKDAQLSGEMSGAFKLFVFGQSLSTRDIFHGAKTFKPCTMLIGCTNHMLSAVDKSGGFVRRFSIFGQPQKLLTSTSDRDDLWIENVKSDQAAQYLLELLVLAHLKSMEAGHLAESSSSMIRATGLFADANDSSQMYVDEVGMAEVIFNPVRTVKQDYESWCELNSVQPLKNKFQSSMSSKFNLVARPIARERVHLDESDLLLNGFSPNVKTIRCWTHNHKLVNDKYDARFVGSASAVEALDLINDDSELTSSIVDAIIKDTKLSVITKAEIISYVSLVFDFRENHTRLQNILKSVLNSFDETYSCSETMVKELNDDILENLSKFSKYDASLKHSLAKKTNKILVYDLSSKINKTNCN